MSYFDTDWSLVDFDDKKPEPPKPAKGVCSKCGAHIGKGLFAHMRACDGNAAKAG